jgi:hypothetical protein
MVLSEYTCAALLLPFFYLLLYPELKMEGVKKISLSVLKGAFLPGLLWCWYHIACFGGIFSLPYKYDVLATAGVVEDPGALWGFISFLPNLHWLLALLVGRSRGIIFTQPWIFFVIFCGLLYGGKMSSKLQRLFLFCIASFVVLLWLNAGFPGWHGGGSPGPRYLAAVLPLFALFIPAFYDELKKSWKILFVLLILSAVVLRGLIYATWILPPIEPLWPYYLGAIHGVEPWLRVFLFGLVLSFASLFYWRRVEN